MTEMEFCQHHCGNLSPEQKVMTQYAITQGTFLGVGQAVSRSIWFPLVSCGKMPPNVIDRAGHRQLATIAGRQGWCCSERSG